MMSTAELKIDLISQITSITDPVKLKELMHLLQFQNEESIYITSEEEKNAVSEAREEIADGKILTNEEVKEEINRWLRK